MDVFTNNMFFGIFISLIAFEIGLFIYKKTKFPLFNPLLIATILVIGFLKIFNIDFDTYNKGGQFINVFLGPATVVLAVPLYKNLSLLKENFLPIFTGIFVGSLAIVLSGIMGAVVGPTVFKVLRINHPIAKGISLGTASHAVGTSKALEIGETEGAMSSLSIGVAGILTVFLAPVCYSILSIFM